MSVKIYGANDDLIEVDGDIYEEFYSDSEGNYLAFSNGVLLFIHYSNGFWTIRPLRATDHVSIEHADNADENYSDTATITGDVTWVVCGEHWAKKRS